MINSEYIVKQLEKNMGSDLFNLLKDCDAMVAGGAL